MCAVRRCADVGVGLGGLDEMGTCVQQVAES